MAKIRKAVIPAAGYGINFLPATKAQPKELLPIVDKPVIQFVVEEAKHAGIEEVLIITGKQKRSIEDHFDSNVELEQNLEAKGKTELLEIARSTTYESMYYVRQSEPKGLADAIYHAKAFVGDEPFIVMLGDTFYEADLSVSRQLVLAYDKVEAPIVAVNEVPASYLSRYGVVGFDGDLNEDSIGRVNQLIEKPDEGQAPSRYATAGRYVLTPEIFDMIEQLDPGVEGELQLTDALQLLKQEQPVYGYLIDGVKYDAGYKIGFVKTSIHHGLNHPETGADFQDFIVRKSRGLRGL